MPTIDHKVKMDDFLTIRKTKRSWAKTQWFFAVALLLSIAVNLYIVQSFLRQRSLSRRSTSVISSSEPLMEFLGSTEASSQHQIKYASASQSPLPSPSVPVDRRRREDAANINVYTAPNTWVKSVSDKASILRQRALTLLGGVANNKNTNGDPSRPPFVRDTKCSGPEADPSNPDHPDCSVLRAEFGLSCTVSGDPPMANTSDPYEKGYIRVPGLTDPSIVAAAIYDESRSINDMLPPRFPLAAVEGFIDNPHGHGVDRPNPITIDVVYTYVDGNEDSFLDDLKYFKGHQSAATASAQEPEPLRNSVKVSTGAVGALTALWESMLRALPKIGLSMTSDRAVSQHRALVEEELKSIEESLAAASQLPVSVNQTILSALRADAGGDDNRFRDYGELRLSLRGIYRHIISPMKRRAGQFTKTAEGIPSGRGVKFSERFGKIYVVVSSLSQRPRWITEEDQSIVWVEHRSLFPNASRSLPTFNSMAIESVIHRIPGLSRHYLYLNNDFIISRPVSFFDYFRPVVVGDEVRFVPAVLVGHVKEYRCKGRERYKDMCFPSGFSWSSEVFINNLWLLKNVFRRDNVPFTLGFVHSPQMIDRLHMARMASEPALRQEICATRGTRRRNSGNLLYGYPFTYYTLWLHHNRDIDAAFAALMASSANDNTLPSIEDSTGRPQRTLWVYLRDEAHYNSNFVGSSESQPSPIKDLWGNIALAAAGGKDGAEVLLPTDELLLMDPANGEVTLRSYSSASPEITNVAKSSRAFGSTDHWLFDVIASLAEPAWNLEPSIRYYFAMVRSKRAAMMHLQDLMPRFGKVLSVALNDDLPTTRDLPHPYFNISQLLVSELCTTMTEKRFVSAVRAGRSELEDVTKRYQSVILNLTENMPPFNATLASAKGLSAVIDFEFPTLHTPRRLSIEANAKVFVERMFEAISGMCKVGAARLALRKVEQAICTIPVEAEVLLAKPSDANSFIYGSRQLVQGFSRASVGDPEGEYSRLIPPWEHLIAD